jgi:hypothetical protein
VCRMVSRVLPLVCRGLLLIGDYRLEDCLPYKVVLRLVQIVLIVFLQVTRMHLQVVISRWLPCAVELTISLRLTVKIIITEKRAKVTHTEQLFRHYKVQ